MNYSHQINKWILVFSSILFLALSCKEEKALPSISLDNISEKIFSSVGHTDTFKGPATGGIESVKVILDNEEIETVSVLNNKFSFELEFYTSGEGILKVEGLNNGGDIVAEAIYHTDIAETGTSYKFVFDFPKPKKADLGSKKVLWATYYNLPVVDAKESGYPLRDIHNKSLGPFLTHKEWCFAAMEGSVVVKFDKKQVTYNYAAAVDGNEVDCTKYFSWNVSRTKFRKATGKYGDGVLDYVLNPYRTIAVDRKVIPYGTVLYIPAARGDIVTLPNGKRAIHDGYFFAGDTGGAIKKTHIDVYLGLAKKSPFSWIKSRESGKFNAYIVEDPSIIDDLSKRHFPKAD